MPFSTAEGGLLQLNQEDFDFNIPFEQLFFSILPSTLFIVTSLWRTAAQARKPTVVNAPVFQLIKLCAITTYVGLELSLLILVAVGSFRVTSIFIASSVLKLVAALLMVSLSVIDHSKSPRPSMLLNSYLFLTLLLDAAQARTLFLSSGDKSELTYSGIFSAALALEVGILLLEAQRKTRWVSWDEKEHSPEETSGIFSLGVYFWLNKIFREGYKKVLEVKDLYPLDSSLDASLLHEEFSRNVDYSKLRGDKYGLVKALIRTLKPFFIQRLLNHLSQPEMDTNVGFGFIGASILIYGGISISTAFYGYFHVRMRTMTRSILVTETYIKATEARIENENESAAVTLMSTDIERIDMGLRTMHDIWASIMQAALAGWMLYSQLGYALQTLIRAPLRFFTNTDTGIVTNLFSQDLNLIDTNLPNGLLNTLFCVSLSIGEAAVMATSSPYMAISYPFIMVILYVLTMFYLRTSRQMRLLDLEAKSPLYTHFLDTIKGIATLRAFGFISKDVQKNALLINTSQRPAYLLLMIQQWLNLVLGLVVMVLAGIMTALVVLLHSNAGFTGASLVTLMNLSENLSGIVIFYTKLETSIGAIARLKAFKENVKPEDRVEEDIVPPVQWPEKGIIELKGVSASYDEEDQNDGTGNLALRNIDLTIRAGEKIAICGRTGSGKSSLIALLLKLLDPTAETAGQAVIDGTPLHRIDRSALRQRIIAMPQRAVFLPDGTTFRANLDPLGASTPDECRAVLAAVDLWAFVRDRGGLDAGMSAGTLSAGQQQLLSLGRALLRRRIRARDMGAGCGASEGGILLLDEVSAHVDHETERVIQEVIRVEFASYTVVAVSHRLDMIMDFDRVVVMDTGEIVEVDNPRVLAGKPGTRFRELVRAGTN